MNDANYRVFVIVVTFNGIKWIDKCLNSLLDSTIPLNIIVIDNNSIDGTQSFIENNYQSVELIKSNYNYGFSHANNIGIRIALKRKAEYIFLLNQDARICQNTVLNLIKVFKKNPKFGILSPIHLNGDGTHFDYNFSLHLTPSIHTNFSYDLFVNKLETSYEVPFVNAAAWLLTSDCINKVGFLETMFSLYGEDNNYIQRLYYHSLKLGVVTDSIIYHDRESRNGKKTISRLYSEERVDLLIFLLNINKSIKHSVILSLNYILKSILKKFLTLSLLELQNDFKNIFYLTVNFKTILQKRIGYINRNSRFEKL